MPSTRGRAPWIPLVLVPASLALGGCSGERDVTHTRIETASHPAAPARAVLVADPNPIHVCERPPLGVTTLSWSTEATSQTEIRVGSPDGKLFTRKGAAGSAQTERWVTDGMVFFLQDSTSADPSAPESTLARVEVRLTTAGCEPTS